MNLFEFCCSVLQTLGNHNRSTQSSWQLEIRHMRCATGTVWSLDEFRSVSFIFTYVNSAPIHINILSTVSNSMMFRLKHVDTNRLAKTLASKHCMDAVMPRCLRTPQTRGHIWQIKPEQVSTSEGDLRLAWCILIYSNHPEEHEL